MAKPLVSASYDKSRFLVMHDRDGASPGEPRQGKSSARGKPGGEIHRRSIILPGTRTPWEAGGRPIVVFGPFANSGGGPEMTQASRPGEGRMTLGSDRSRTFSRSNSKSVRARGSEEIGLRWESRGSPIYSAGLCSRAASIPRRPEECD